jgi:pimeloyl-ACP methyl ester carboxylesterase
LTNPALTNSAANLPALFCLHYLGGSGREFAPLAERLGPGFRVLPIDLAGFGDAHASFGYAVADMTRAVAAAIRAAAAHRWLLLGHSMGAKVATVLTSQIEQGSLALPGLASLVLLAGSPPSPEPMGGDKRETLLQWFHGDAETTRSEGSRYLDQNVSRPLTTPLRAQALEDLERMNRDAWTAWLTSGSREDWSERVGTLRTPALLVAGADDSGLGVDAQRKYMAPHFSSHTLRVVENAAHLLPLEAAADVARLIREHEAALRDQCT